jgi:hypothetical protein
MDLRKRDIRGVGLVLILLMAFVGCVSNPIVKKEKMYAPIEASLCHINQKVAGHFLESGIPDGFDAIQYRIVVEQVCFPNPNCKSQAEGILDSFGIKARKVDDMFSVMLCGKDMMWKIMEDFSCNNRRVEVQSWRVGYDIPCNFETDWQSVKQKYCNQ